MIRFLCAFAALWVFTGSAQAVSPAFDCKKASTPVEKAICGDQSLSALDRMMAALYTDTVARAAEVDKKNLDAQQKAWLKTRNACAKDASMIDCLRTAYGSRIKALRPEQTAAPGFNCAKASTATEKMICGSTELSAVDGVLSALYMQARKNASDEEKKKMEATQKSWLKERNACKDIGCLYGLYAERLDGLMGATASPSPSPSPSALPVPAVSATETAAPSISVPAAEGASMTPPVSTEKTTPSAVAANTDWVNKIAANLPAIDACIMVTPALPVMVSDLDTEKGILNVRLRANDGRAWGCMMDASGARVYQLTDVQSSLVPGAALFSRAPQPAFKGECITIEKMQKDGAVIGWLSRKGC